MAKKIDIVEERMLALMEWAVNQKVVPNETEYLERIDFPRTAISLVRSGKQGFTKKHILNASLFTGANINWIFGLESNIMRRPGKTPLDLLKEAVAALEVEKNKKLPKELPKAAKKRKSTVL